LRTHHGDTENGEAGMQPLFRDLRVSVVES
jgi:hypothetical protein